MSRKNKPKGAYGTDFEFQPKICAKSKQLTENRAPFHERVGDIVTAHEKTLQNRAKSRLKVSHSFKPALNFRPDLEAKLKAKGKFMKRVKNDIANRRQKMQNLNDEALSDFTFTPAVNGTKNGHGKKIKGTFLQRVETDIADRKERLQGKAPNVLDPECTFVPEISKQTKKHFKKKGESFFQRMENDIEKRTEKHRANMRFLSKPPKIKKKKVVESDSEESDTEED